MALASALAAPAMRPAATFPDQFSPTCPHMGGPLAAGTIRDGEVTCPWHRYRFDVASGEGRGLACLLGLSLRQRTAGR